MSKKVPQNQVWQHNFDHADGWVAPVGASTTHDPSGYPERVQSNLKMASSMSKSMSCRICSGVMRKWRTSWLGFDWGRCIDCKSVQKLIALSRYEALGATYDPGYIEGGQVSQRELVERMAVDEKEKLLRDLLGPDAGGSLLDIGCGMGGYLLAGKRLGMTVTGVEPSAAHSAAAVEVFGLDVMQEYFNPNDFDRKFDVVILSHVIEHIYEPVAFVQGVMEVLRPGGKLIIVTPNCNSLSARICMKFWSMYKPVDHVTLFSKEALGNVVPRDASLETLKTSEWPGEFAAHLLSSIKTVCRPVATGAAPGKPEGPTRTTTLSFATKAVLGVVSLPAYWFGCIFDRQSCLYAVVQKNR